MRTRIFTVLGCAVVLGIWVYGNEKGNTLLHRDTAALCALALAVGAGFLVRRWWVLLALAGPLIALGYLEVSGFVGTSSDWAGEPLLSPPGISTFFWLGLPLLLGISLANGWEWLVDTRKRA